MRALALAGAMLLLLALPSRAQTTGAFCANDYTINGLVPGSTSCPPPLVFPGGPSRFTVITRNPGVPVILLVSLVTPCCPGLICLPPSGCPIPFTACGGTTNQSLDICPNLLQFPCGVTVPDPATGCGICNVVIAIPPGINFTTQAVILDPAPPLGRCGVPGFDFLLTQAYEVRTF